MDDDNGLIETMTHGILSKFLAINEFGRTSLLPFVLDKLCIYPQHNKVRMGVMCVEA